MVKGFREPKGVLRILEELKVIIRNSEESRNLNPIPCGLLEIL